MKNWTVVLLLSLSLNALSAQKGLEGLWEGTITIGGIHSSEAYRFELLLAMDGPQVKGRSFVYLPENEVIEMEVQGYLYQDRSVYLQDVRFFPTEGKAAMPPFYRKYEFRYLRSIWDSSLEGFWQEIREDSFFPNRNRGRILLRRREPSKA